MKVFISWSGDRSRCVAQALRDWLPLVLHYVQPWMSQADIDAGDRWGQEVAKELEACNFGIICVTPENLNAPWLLFEAGALAKSMVGAKVIPLLYRLENSAISGPLTQFQAKKFDQTGLMEVIRSINLSASQPVPEERVKALFPALWPDFDTSIQGIPGMVTDDKLKRPQDEILEELVSSVRGLDARLRDIETNSGEHGPRSKRRRLRELSPMMIDAVSHMVSEDGDDPVSLLMLAGLLKEDLPWLHEVLLEAYREIRVGDPKLRQLAIERLRRLLRNLRRNDFMMEFGDHSKEAHMFLMELPRMIDRLLHRFDHRGTKLPEGQEDAIEA